MTKLQVTRFYVGEHLMGSYGQTPGQSDEAYNAEVRRTAENISLEMGGAFVGVMQEVNISL